MNSNIAAAIFAALGMAAAHAGDGVVGPVTVDVVSLYVAKAAPRDAGSVTVTVVGSFSLPPGVKCDSTYLTTGLASDPDRSMFRIATQALDSRQTVRLYITDDSALAAYPGRCSLKGIELSSRLGVW